MSWLWFTVDRILRQIHTIEPVHPDGVMGMNIKRHRGPAITLADGTKIKRGERLLEVHLNSSWFRQKRSPSKTTEWEWVIVRAMSADLAILAETMRNGCLVTMPLHGFTFLGVGAKRLGFEVIALDNTRTNKLQRFYLSKLMKTFYLNSGTENRTPEKSLRLYEIWMSPGAFFNKYHPDRSNPES